MNAVGLVSTRAMGHAKPVALADVKVHLDTTNNYPAQEAIRRLQDEKGKVSAHNLRYT